MAKTSRVTRQELEEIFKEKKGKVLHSPFFSLRFVELSSIPKFAFIVSKKEFKKAVLRNKAKRRMRAIARGCGRKPGIYIFSLKKALLSSSFIELKEETTKIFLKIEKDY